MEEKIKYRYTATGRTGTRILTPVNSSGFAVSYNPNEEKLDYVLEFSDKLQFIGDDFLWLYMFEKTIYRCDFIYLKIEKYCSGNWVPFLDGRMSLNSGDNWNIDKSTVELSISESNQYDCLEDGFDKEYNLLNSVFTRVAAKSLSGTIESQKFSIDAVDGEPVEFFPGEPDPTSKGWLQRAISYEYQYDLDPPSPNYKIDVEWVREVITLPVATVLPSPWVEISNDGTNHVYARFPILYKQVLSPYNSSTPRDFYISYDILDSTIDNGMKLKDVFTFFIGQICSDLSLESDFFQWNPVTPSAINYVTSQPTKVNNLLLFQKSDVKRPYTGNNANQANISFEDLLKSICNIWPLRYEITNNGKFKIEHVNYYKNKGIGLDTTIPLWKLFTAGNRVYSYDKDSIPKKETFRMMDMSYGDFKGNDIIYNGSCAGLGDQKEQDYSVEKITTDVQLCLNNPEPDSKVSDDGFVLMACDATDSIIREPSILGGNSLNNSLAWAQLHRDYWRYDRPQRSFLMNGVLTTAYSVRPTKIQADFSIPLCCTDFDPKKFVKSSLGNEGIVKNATYDMYSETLTLGLLFDAEEGLIDNNAPTTIGDASSTFKNVDVTIDVLANDVDSDGIIIPSTLTILYPPIHGTAIITPDFKIKYTPAVDYVGMDVIIYTVSDNLGEPSLNTIVNITVKNGTPTIIANDDNFAIAKNVTLNQSAPGLLLNDTGPSVLTTVSESKPTSQGGSVVIHNDGSFDYTPPTGFTGSDVFSYTALDIASNPSVADCNINVFEPVDIYVSMVETGDAGANSIIENCSSVPTVTGEQKINSYTLYFWSNLAKTVPINVSGYGLKVKIRYDIYDHSVPSSNYDVLVDGVGTSVVFESNYLTVYRYVGCSGLSDINTERTLSLQPGTGYNI